MSALTLAGACGSPTASLKCESRGPAGSVAEQRSACPAAGQHRGSSCAFLVWITQSQLPQEALHHNW